MTLLNEPFIGLYRVIIGLYRILLPASCFLLLDLINVRNIARFLTLIKIASLFYEIPSRDDHRAQQAPP